MRICVIPPDQKTAHTEHISSGQERVARDQARLLARAGHHVDYWTVNTSNNLSSLGFNHRVMYDVQPRAFFNSHRPNPQTRQKKQWCKENIDNYDIFLCHTDSSTFLKEFARLGVGHRVISFIHAPFAGTMWGIGFNSGQGRAKWAGATIATVSERCRSHWNKWSRTTRQRLLGPSPGKISRPDLLNSDVVHEEFVTRVLCPQFSTVTADVLPASSGPIVLSRIAPEKKIHIAFGTGSTFVCRKDNKKYFEKLETKFSNESFLFDLPYSDCMEHLRTAQLLISTWKDETSGINAFEAAERGVPVILCEEAGSPHASRDFLPPWGFITCEDNATSLKDALNSVPKEWSTMRFRQALADHTRKNWGETNYSKALNKLVNEVFEVTQNLPVTPHKFGKR